MAQQAQAPANRRRISGGQALVLLAVWTAILPFTWVSVAPGVDRAGVDPAVVVVHGCIVAVTATPLVFARLGRAALRRASLVASLLLFVAILPLGPLMAVDPELDRVGKPGAELDECGAEVIGPQVHVEDRDPALLLGEGELRGLGRVGVAFAGGPHRGELLGHPDRGDLRPAGPGRPIQVWPHHLDFAVIAPKPHHRDVVVLGEAPHAVTEPAADLVEHRRRRDRHAAVLVQEVHDPAGVCRRCTNPDR